MQTYLLGDEESAVCIQSRRWRFGLRRSATDNSLWLKNPSKRLFTYIQTIADRRFFEVPRKGRCPGCPKKECLAIDFGQWTVFLLHDRVFVLHIRDSFIEESHMVMVHEFGDQEVQPNVRP
jgi:hypothetical protein